MYGPRLFWFVRLDITSFLLIPFKSQNFKSDRSDMIEIYLNERVLYQTGSFRVMMTASISFP